MKVCETCGADIDGTKDGESRCAYCEEVVVNQENLAVKARQRAKRRVRDAAMRSCGLVKVKGALGGTYWE